MQPYQPTGYPYHPEPYQHSYPPVYTPAPAVVPIQVQIPCEQPQPVVVVQQTEHHGLWSWLGSFFGLCHHEDSHHVEFHSHGHDSHHSHHRRHYGMHGTHRHCY